MGISPKSPNKILDLKIGSKFYVSYNDFHFIMDASSEAQNFMLFLDVESVEFSDKSFRDFVIKVYKVSEKEYVLINDNNFLDTLMFHKKSDFEKHFGISQELLERIVGNLPENNKVSLPSPYDENTIGLWNKILKTYLVDKYVKVAGRDFTDYEKQINENMGAFENDQVSDVEFENHFNNLFQVISHFTSTKDFKLFDSKVVYFLADLKNQYLIKSKFSKIKIMTIGENFSRFVYFYKTLISTLSFADFQSGQNYFLDNLSKVVKLVEGDRLKDVEIRSMVNSFYSESKSKSADQNSGKNSNNNNDEFNSKKSGYKQLNSPQGIKKIIVDSLSGLNKIGSSEIRFCDWDNLILNFENLENYLHSFYNSFVMVDNSKRTTDLVSECDDLMVDCSIGVDIVKIWKKKNIQSNSDLKDIKQLIVNLNNILGKYLK